MKIAHVVTAIARFLKKLVFLNRRKRMRIPCSLSVQFLSYHKESQVRGAGIITDITEEGLCCNNIRFYREDIDLRFKYNTDVLFFFSLPGKTGTQSFQISGRIRSITHDAWGEIKRAGVQISAFKQGSLAELKQCIERLQP